MKKILKKGIKQKNSLVLKLLLKLIIIFVAFK